MDKPREIVIHIVTSDPETGIWCDRCSLPSKVRVRASMLTTHGVSDVAVVERCVHCDD